MGSTIKYINHDMYHSTTQSLLTLDLFVQDNDVFYFRTANGTNVSHNKIRGGYVGGHMLLMGCFLSHDCCHISCLWP